MEQLKIIAKIAKRLEHSKNNKRKTKRKHRNPCKSGSEYTNKHSHKRVRALALTNKHASALVVVRA